MWDVNPFGKLPPRRLAANTRFSKACDALARAEAAYRTAKTPSNQIAVSAARRQFVKAKADRLADR
jgi:hypothetical protein